MAGKLGDISSLVGKTVDGYGNIVDSSGKLVGKASGDITEMVGRTVDESGNIVSSTGDIIGHVTENIGLGKILDTGDVVDDKGNVFGKARSNFKPSPVVDSGDTEPKKLHMGPGLGTEIDHPTDIFLNVQSTREGISITIRIPTGFIQQQQGK